jgi:hypothetical protein
MKVESMATKEIIKIIEGEFIKNKGAIFCQDIKMKRIGQERFFEI